MDIPRHNHNLIPKTVVFISKLKLFEGIELILVLTFGFCYPNRKNFCHKK